MEKQRAHHLWIVRYCSLLQKNTFLRCLLRADQPDSRFIPLHATTGPIPLIKSAFSWHNETGTLIRPSSRAVHADPSVCCSQHPFPLHPDDPHHARHPRKPLLPPTDTCSPGVQRLTGTVRTIRLAPARPPPTRHIYRRALPPGGRIVLVVLGGLARVGWVCVEKVVRVGCLCRL